MVNRGQVLGASILLCAVGSPARAATRPVTAVLVGIDTPTPGSGWAPLQAGRDVAQLASVLEDLAGPELVVHRLVDERATKPAILAALAPDAHHEGTHVWLHFSGHGVQVVDTSGDEPDGTDEALVPFGARIGQDADLLLDDTLGAQLDLLRAGLGPTGRLTVSIDACHGGGTVRGLATPPGWLDASSAPHLAPMTVLAATRSGGLTTEQPRGGGGVWTGRLVDALQAAGPSALWNDVLTHLQATEVPDSVVFWGVPTTGIWTRPEVSPSPSSIQPSLTDAAVAVRPQLVDVDVRQDCSATGPRSGPIELTTRYGLEVAHTGTQPAWLEVHHEDSSGATTPIWPASFALADPLHPGSTWRVPVCLEATAPTGTEAFVIRSRSRPSHHQALRGARVVEAPLLVWEARLELEVVDP